MRVTMEGKYRTLGGRSVRILCVDRNSLRFPVIALVQDDKEDHEEALSFTSEGTFRHTGTTHCLDLVEVSEWDAFTVDEQVMVSDYPNSGWVRRYFAGISEAGFPMAFPGGRTSWTIEDKVLWKYCRRPTKEEL